ncbi:MAG: peptidylprolyl isomerase [Candidatus Eisenbacteria bacterium]
MKTHIAFLIALLLATTVAAEELVDRIVAIVDADPIFLSDVDAALAEDLYLRSVRGEPMPGDSAEVEMMREALLESVIDRRIVIAKARALEIEVTRTDVEDALDQWLGEMIATAGSESAFLGELKRQGITLKEFKTRYRRDIEEQLLVSRFMRQEFGEIRVSETEISDFYETKYDSIPGLPEAVGLSHIIIVPKISAEREAEAVEKIDRIVTRINRNEPFESVAAEVSDDVLTRDDGGMIGLVRLDDLQGEIADIAIALEPGHVSDPIRTRYGFEIVKLDGRQEDKYRLRHILVKLQPAREDTLSAADLAEEVRSRAASGESFESLARQYSDDEDTREEGGYVGQVEVSALEEGYSRGLEGLNPGDVSDVIKTRFGFQILKLMGRSASRRPSLEEAREWIRGVVETRKREALFTEWLEEAREEIYVKRL